VKKLKHNNHTSAWDILLGEKDEVPQTSDEDVENEFKKYWSEKLAGRESDPLVWWSTHASTYPTVSVIAKKFLTSPATSAPSERAFSNAGLTVTCLRNLLSPETVDSLVFLSKNYSLLSNL
jgi:hypothetical protein